MLRITQNVIFSQQIRKLENTEDWYEGTIFLVKPVKRDKYLPKLKLTGNFSLGLNYWQSPKDA